jgi:uncharacterized protein
MNPADLTPVAVGGYILIFLGLVGTVVPILPGPLLIWLGALVWAWGDGFARVGWPTLLLLLILALAAWISDYALNMIFSRRAGASWKAIIGAMLGGIAGGILLSGLVPVLGTLIGAALGAMAGAFAVEYLNTRNFSAAWRALKAYLGSMIASSILEVLVAFLMVGVFYWQAFL